MGQAQKKIEDQVKNFEFKPLDIDKDLEAVNFKEFEDQVKTASEFEKTIYEERTSAKEKRFQISPIVENYRGIKEQEEREIADMIEAEVQVRYEALKEQAYNEGYELGKQEGVTFMQDSLKAQVNEKLEMLMGLIHQASENQVNLLENQKNEIYSLVRNLSKWVILRELEEDGQYLERLLQKLILEMGSQINLLIQVNKDDFSKMPEVLEVVEKRLGELTNVRVEIDDQVESGGMIIESENGIIKATLEEQLKSITELFSSVEEISEESE